MQNCPKIHPRSSVKLASLGGKSLSLIEVGASILKDVPLVSVPSEDESIENFTKGNVKDWIGHCQSQRGVKAVIRVMTDAGGM